MPTKPWYEDIHSKYIRDKERFITSMDAKLDTPLAFRNRTERAAKDGLVYLCQDSVKKHSAWYQLPCGHIKLLSTSDFYNKVFTCYGCHVLLWEKEAKEAGITFLEKVDGERALYELECGHQAILSTSHVRTYKHRKRFCKECFIKELTEQAKEHGLEFIRKSDANRKAIYRFPCGHEHVLYTSHVKRGTISCPKCDRSLQKRFKTRMLKKDKNENLDEEQFDKSLSAQKGRATSIAKWTQQAEKLGLTFLCRDVDSGSLGWYELPCKHIRRISINNVRKAKDANNFNCPYCKEEERKKAAKNKGLTLLKILNSDKALYQFDACGHMKEVYISDVDRNNKIICNDCILDKWKEEAREADLRFIKRTLPKKALYECQNCRTEQEFFVIAVRNQEFTCRGCHPKEEKLRT